MLFRYLFLAFVATALAAGPKGNKGCRRAGQKRCQGSCVDVMTSNQHCGNCKTVCDQNSSCVSGLCKANCDGTLCGGVCTDTTQDNNNCGACNNPCNTSKGYYCSNSKCIRDPRACNGDNSYVTPNNREYYIACNKVLTGGTFRGTVTAIDIYDCIDQCSTNSNSDFVNYAHSGQCTCGQATGELRLEDNADFDTAGGG